MWSAALTASNCQMSHSDCCRALGVAPDATWEEVRQAYIDLVRVWHPDRFQSDARLLEKAGKKLQYINEAYLTLKNSPAFSGCQSEPAPQPPPSPVPPPSRRRLNRFLRDLQFRWPLRIAGLALACLLLLFLAGVFHALRIPYLDAILLQASEPRATMLMPSRFIDPLDGKLATADELSRWARGEAAEIGKLIPATGEAAPDPRVAASFAPPQPDNAAPGSQPQPRTTPAVRPVPPVNGTEVLWTRRSGAGELWVSNETSRDALATLVQAQTARPLRAIYVQAKSKACMHSIAPGLYDLLAEVGEDWDQNHLRFRAGRQALDKRGPFQCIDVSSAQGTYGCKYDVVLRVR